MKLRSEERRVIYALALLSGLTVFLFISRVVATRSWYYWFLMENLVLAWLPLVFGWLLVKSLGKPPWKVWPSLPLAALWLVFLPNAWYVLTDFVHATPTGQISQRYDIILISSLVIAGFALGYTSLFMVHKKLLEQLSQKLSWLVVGAILLIASFAIYLGRDLRWSSWDIVADPSGVVLDVSDRAIHPLGHPHSWNMTGSVFLLLGTTYGAVWLLAEPGDAGSPKKRQN